MVDLGQSDRVPSQQRAQQLPVINLLISSDVLEVFLRDEVTLWGGRGRTDTSCLFALWMFVSDSTEMKAGHEV